MYPIIFLNGTIGAGKSFVGAELAKRGCTRVLIDDIYARVPRINPHVKLYEDIPYMRRTWAIAEKELLAKAKSRPVVFESTGINQPWWNRLYAKCKAKNKNVKIVWMYAPLRLIWERMKERNKREHGHRICTHARTKRIHSMVLAAKWKHDLVIVNKDKKETLLKINGFFDKIE